MPSKFNLKKLAILKQLAEPSESYNDLSPKGSVDGPIRSLIEDINSRDGFVTTSSCSGRISVFLEGRRQTEQADDQSSSQPNPVRSSVGGKGGGSWQFVSHEPVVLFYRDSAIDLHDLFGLRPRRDGPSIVQAHTRFVHLKFEAMILHVLTASSAYAQELLAAALASGFRESGAVGLASSSQQESTPTVAVRSTGLGFDAVVGYETDVDGVQTIHSLVDESYLRILVGIANSRFTVNSERIARFHDAMSTIVSSKVPLMDKEYRNGLRGWEGSAARRERKRLEGMQRQQRRREAVASKNNAPEHDIYDAGTLEIPH